MDDMEVSGKIARLEENLKSLHKRLDENDKVTNGIHKIAANMELLTHKMANVSDSIDEIKESQKSQGARIGDLETKPMLAMQKIVMQVLTLMVAAAVGVVLARIGLTP